MKELFETTITIRKHAMTRLESIEKEAYLGSNGGQSNGEKTREKFNDVATSKFLYLVNTYMNHVKEYNSNSNNLISTI